VTEAELAVLQVLWDQGAATRRQIADVLYPGGSPAHYTTVQKLLERLQTKRLVTRRQQGGVWVFGAAIDREELISRRLRSVADQLCGGSLTPLLMNLVRAQPLSPRQLQELQDLIKDLERQNRSRDKR
jgi:predicted transcriptional regulator